MAKRKMIIPEYGTVIKKGVLYYRTRIKDADGKLVALYARTPEELYNKETIALEQIENATFHRKTPTVAEYCEKWLLMQSVHVRTTTLTDYTSKVRRHIIAELGDKRMGEVSLDDIQLALVSVSNFQQIAFGQKPLIVQKTEENMKRRWKLTILVLLALTLLYFHKTHPVQLDTFLSWRPENTLLAVITVVFVFTLKALTVFIPLRPLQIMTGHLFSAPAAVAVNVLGQLIVASVPYWTGRKAGQKKVRTLLEKHPKASAILTIQNRNPLAASFFPRACAFPLGDLVTMYLGATGIPYGCNVIGSVLGCLPSMLLATFLGASIQEPDSPEFWLALILNIAWIVVSGLVFYLYRKYSVRKEVTP